jgi:ABC-type dipeptide/oligopeptide/nickel transport system ATPase component
MNTNTQNLLKIDNLCISINKNDIIKDVSIQINKGEMIGLVGESGCGKSLTALSIIKLIDENVMKVKSGEIQFLGKNLLSKTEKELEKIRGKEISMIFQEPMTSLNPVFSIGDQINEVLFIHNNLRKKIATDKTIDLLSKVGIPRPEISYKKYPHQLSGGQRQRVMIAMALACSPKLLIADEPTTALDVIVQSQILNIINNLRRELNMSVLLITHDLGLVQDFCDRVYVMYDGKILENADSVKLFKSPQHQYTKDLLMTRPAANPPGKRLPIIKNTY